ncbi:MAG: phospholipase D-like domain-containing protein [Candidatus Bathyarchaeia archaeon]|jgi:hypothetical protein
MAKFLSCSELYETVQQKSSEAKEILWACSPYLGLEAHTIFSQEILKNPPADIRFVFRVNDVAVKRAEVNPYEIQYFMEHFKGSSIRSHDIFHSNIYIFGDSALITSANMTKTAFESNIEAGVLLDTSQVDEVKSFFNKGLWENAKPLTDVKKYKKLWNIGKKTSSTPIGHLNKVHTKIKDWTDDYVNTWYFAIPDPMSKKTSRKILKEANWPTELRLVGDIGPSYFKQLKLGDLAFVADLTKKRSQVLVELARIFDKSRVETDQGDFHFAYETKKTYSIEKSQFHEMLENANMGSKSWAIMLNEDQVKLMTNTLSSRKPRKLTKS